MSDLAPDTSNAVLKACIKLRGTEDFMTSINEVTADIRSICGASRCTILDIDEDNEMCHILGNSHLPGFRPLFEENEINLKHTDKHACSMIKPLCSVNRGVFHVISCVWTVIR
ncbi:MAG: hypothetical protein K6F34_07190 [Lachnospiraceae bacterium]|nr:hypothetical protein [Lachnospiraceae bacterium]